ncbi:MAG: ABC transporter ATP-binding protein [Synergistaceae bacterium]|jgi:peptide/nickel transport system ATP-binding protein|nr:ABC transporter ATP-binding protein [Synergistaceae bacterium]
MSNRLLEVKNLVVKYRSGKTAVHAVNGISFGIRKGESLGLVGETGAGKTTTALAILRLIASPPGKIEGGEVEYDGKNLLELPESGMRHIRGNRISMIFQDPMTSLNPVMTVGDQIAATIRLHRKKSRKDAAVEARNMLELVGIPGERYNEYPHQFSGGMKQRVMIAIALSCNPSLLIADEPTTALDVTIQAQVLDLIEKLKREFDTSLLLITHDLGVVAEVCENAAIMYAGEIVEYGNLRHIYKGTLHPYTQGLFESIPNIDEDVRRLKPIEGMMADPTRLPQGCAFALRCPYKDGGCEKNAIPVFEPEPGHLVKCLKWSEIKGSDRRKRLEERRGERIA